MSAPGRNVLVYGALLLQTAISAGTYLAAKHALGTIHWPAVVMLRNAGSGVLFAALVRAAPGPSLPPRRDLGRVLLLGLLGVPLNQGLFIAGLERSSPAHAALLYTLTPLFVLLLGVVAGAERIEARKLVGLILALGGAAWVVLERTPRTRAAPSLEGDALILTAVLAWALYTTLGRPLVRTYGSIQATAWPLVAGTLLFAPFGAWQAVEVDFPALPATVWWALAYLVLFTSVVAYLCWSYALAHLEPSRVAIFTNLQPVATAALSWAVYGEAITAGLAWGGALVVSGVIAATQGPGNRFTRPASTTER